MNYFFRHTNAAIRPHKALNVFDTSNISSLNAEAETWPNVSIIQPAAA